MESTVKVQDCAQDIQELAELLKRVPQDQRERLLEQMKFGAMVAVMFSKKEG